ncbi:phosphotransferase family protein [Actinomadura kijaniata]|uniref:phosphotransferase family protein n=1 Tax=Actinomadura kijaniata TaxID=46161 RepID=UPI00082B7F51|nr:phosphotransferase [Actinomadura kijaniata]
MEIHLPVTDRQIQAMCHRAFGVNAQVRQAVEFGRGLYNTVLRVQMDGQEPFVLRIAPHPSAQARSERELLRNEYATAPFLAGLAIPTPRLLFADFTGEVIDRDWMMQTLLPGVSASDALRDFPQQSWPHFYAQLGGITRTVRQIPGNRDRFSPSSAPGTRPEARRSSTG